MGFEPSIAARSGSKRALRKKENISFLADFNVIHLYGMMQKRTLRIDRQK